MKTLCTVIMLLGGFFTAFFHCAKAQDYIITNRGDSLTGEVKPQLYGPEKKVQITSPDKEKTLLSLFEVRAFSFEDEIYHPVKGENSYVFMKLIQPGYLSLYAYQQDNQMRYDGLLMKKLDGQRVVVPNLGFKKHIARFLEDCPDVSDKIEEGILGRNDLTTIIDQYNACISGRTLVHQEVIVQRKDQSTTITAWDALEESVKGKDFEGKTDAMDMISEIRKKIQRQEKIPNFLLEGLKSSLKGTGLTAQLDQAILELNY